MRVAQQGSKGLQTPQSNSIIGRYFRKRLGVADGAPVDLADLQRFGSRFVAFYKVEDDAEGPAYVMDYSPEYEDRGSAFYKL